MVERVRVLLCATPYEAFRAWAFLPSTNLPRDHRPPLATMIPPQCGATKR